MTRRHSTSAAPTDTDPEPVGSNVIDIFSGSLLDLLRDAQQRPWTPPSAQPETRAPQLATKNSFTEACFAGPLNEDQQILRRWCGQLSIDRERIIMIVGSSIASGFYHSTERRSRAPMKATVCAGIDTIRRHGSLVRDMSSNAELTTPTQEMTTEYCNAVDALLDRAAELMKIEYPSLHTASVAHWANQALSVSHMHISTLFGLGWPCLSPKAVRAECQLTAMELAMYEKLASLIAPQVTEAPAEPPIDEKTDSVLAYLQHILSLLEASASQLHPSSVPIVGVPPRRSNVDLESQSTETIEHRSGRPDASVSSAPSAQTPVPGRSPSEMNINPDDSPAGRITPNAPFESELERRFPHVERQTAEREMARSLFYLDYDAKASWRELSRAVRRDVLDFVEVQLEELDR